MQEQLKCCWPYFGGKSTIASDVWERFGDVRNYVEPFVGSAAVLLGRPLPFDGVETINDMNGYLSNAWRAIRLAPDEVAFWADNPVSECDMHANHGWLVNRRDEIVSQLEGDPDWFDAKAAGRWIHGMCCWIGSGWCSGEGPWHSVDMEDGTRQLVHLGNAGRGVNRKRVHLGNAGRDSDPPACGVNRKMPHMNNHASPARGIAGAGDGVSRKRPLITNDAVGVAANEGVYEWMNALAERLKRVRVCCGDWSRVCGPTPTIKQGLTAVFLDPPYPSEDRADVYGHTEDRTVAADVFKWCKQWENEPKMRICLAGYFGEYDLPGWEVVRWRARGGFGSQRKDGTNDNASRETLWFSPHCIKPESERMLF